MLLRLIGLTCVLAVACDDTAPFVFQAAVVDAAGGNPAAGTDADELLIQIREGDGEPRNFEFPISNGQFDATLDFESFVDLTRVRVSLQGATTDLVAAPPQFVPAVSGAFMRVVATPPGSCVRIAFDMMDSPREAFGMVQSGTFALLVGGTTAEEEQVEFLDVLEWDSRLFDEDFSLSTLGPTRAAPIDEGQILVLPTNATAFVFDMLDAQDRISSVVLHPGAGPRSALVSIPGRGAMVIGGEIGGEAQSAVSLVDSEGTVTALQLSAPRSLPAAAALGDDVLVVGGEPAGTAEILPAGGTQGQSLSSAADGVREDGVLVTDGQNRALLVGGAGEGGEVRQDTLRFDDCPGTCSSSAGPSWTSARLEVLQPFGSTLLIGGAESAEVDEVQWSGSEPTFVSLVELAVPRASAGAIVLESGLFIVGGGNDGVSARDDFEVCVPESLEPL